MPANLIKFFSIFYCIILIYRKNMYINPKFKFMLPVLPILLSIISLIVSELFKELTFPIPLLLFWIIVSCVTSNSQKSFAISIIAFGISFSIYALISFLLTFILYPLCATINFPYTILALLTTFFHIIFINSFLKIKRFQNSHNLLCTKSTINMATIVGILFISISVYITSKRTYSTFQTAGIIGIISLIAFISFFFTLTFLIYWWQAQITKSYRRSLELRELESTKTELAELKLKLQELTDENERLARITHRDNTLISALKNSTVKYLSTDFENTEEARKVRNELIENINNLSAGRDSLLRSSHTKTAREFHTGLSLLDSLLNEMDAKALVHNITFSVHMGTTLDNFVPNDISESDLVHTVDDLLKNAFKSTLTSEKRAVQLQFYKLGKYFVIEVADSGIPFEVESLVNMGIEKRTTYADGSGIGLMDIWNTKETYGATYHLDECVNSTPFSKKISLTFDKKNRYSIRSLRKAEIQQMSRRADLQVYDYNE